MCVIVSAIVSFPSPSIFAVSGHFEKDCTAAYLMVIRVLAGGPGVESPSGFSILSFDGALRSWSMEKE